MHHRSPEPVPPSRPRRLPRLGRTARALALATLSASVIAGCGDAGELQSAGATPTAVSPDRLWPHLTPASSPAFEIGEVDTKVIKGVAVPHGDIRDVDPVAVVRAEIAAAPGDYGAGAYDETARLMADCGRSGTQGRKCPVLKAYYRDLTGDGRDEMTLGFRQLPGKLTAVRVYTVRDRRLVQVMAYEDAVSGVELAGRSVIIRSPSEVAGYEYRLQWTWDQQQHAMLLTHDEMLRTGDPRRPAGRSPGPTPSPARPPSASSSTSGR
ncbi:hypothetical protein ACIBVL_35100 [Streptomyces sp. NPDC049687]|uniref:hypothetical protein n=1 Tax=Streptomyces sp. NPDC049687 TaxID=3365596 RepID=UPI0037905693